MRITRKVLRSQDRGFIGIGFGPAAVLIFKEGGGTPLPASAFASLRAGQTSLTVVSGVGEDISSKVLATEGLQKGLV